MRTATVRHTEAGCEISSFWDEGFLHDLKAEVPHFARKWDPERKLWAIKGTYVTVAVEIARRYFRVVELNSKSEQQQQRTQSEQRYNANSAHAVLHLLPTAPPELIKTAFRTLAQKYHPDHGGSTDQMQRLNQAYSELTK